MCELIVTKQEPAGKVMVEGMLLFLLSLIKASSTQVSTKSKASSFLKLEKELWISFIEIEVTEVPKIRIIADTLNHYVPKKQRPDWKIFFGQLKEKIREASD